MQKSFQKIAIISVILLILFPALFISASADTLACTIDSVKIDSELEYITVSASLDKEFVQENKDSAIFVFELLPSDNIGNLNSLVPIMQTYASESLSKEIDFNKRMIYSSFVLATKNEDGTYTPISNRKYVENPGILSSNDMPYPERATKKGLCAQITSDAQYLGSAHTIISIEIDEYMAPNQSDDAIAYTCLGQTFYFYKDRLSALDHRVKSLTEAGMNVYFNIVMGKSESGDLDFLYLGNDQSSASLFAINTTTVPSSRYFIAFSEFMTERYSSENAENGFVPGYILGYEVNTTGMWNHAGDIGFEDYVRYYENAYRILHSALKSKFANGRVFISVSNLFSADEATSDFGAKSFLDTFAQNIKAGGDIDWALAINPYASDPANTEFWLDENATHTPDTPYLTMKNLDVLSEFMKNEPLLYNGDVRNIIISEFGINGNYDDARNNDCQAGAYALAYAIADQNKDIDAFIYYRHVDYPAEPVHLGLWTSNAVTPLSPENKKSIYEIFRNADTAKFSVGLDMARAFCGDELFEKYAGDYEPVAKKSITEAVPVLKSDIRPIFKERTLFDLTGGELLNFYPSDSSSYVELRPVSENEYTSQLYSSQKLSSTKTYSGISRDLSDIDLERAEYITVSFKPVTPTAQTVTVMLRLDNNSGRLSHSFEGIVQITSNEKSELTFKISDYVKATDGKLGLLKLLYKPSSESVEAGEYGLWLENITVHEKTGITTFITVIVTIFTVLIILLLVAALLFVNFNKNAKNRIKGIVGKTKSRIIGFLKDKKIISRRHKKKKGARLTPPKEREGEKISASKPNTASESRNVQAGGVRIVNGRVIPGPRNKAPTVSSSRQNKAHADNSFEKEREKQQN